MNADTLTLAKLLVTAALLAATAEYIELIKRRAVRNRRARERAMFEEQGLNGLVRVFLAGAPDLRWVRNPTSQPSSSVAAGSGDR